MRVSAPPPVPNIKVPSSGNAVFIWDAVGAGADVIYPESFVNADTLVGTVGIVGLLERSL